MKYNISVTVDKRIGLVTISNGRKKTYFKNKDIDTVVNKFIYENHFNDTEGSVKFRYIT